MACCLSSALSAAGMMIINTMMTTQLRGTVMYLGKPASRTLPHSSACLQSCKRPAP